jgi:Bacteriophage abortive infection AbiH
MQQEHSQIQYSERKRLMSSKLFVIGNGFDLSLGLRTSYGDFLKSDEFLQKINLTLFQYLKNVSETSRWIDIEFQLSVYSSKYLPTKLGNGGGDFLSEYKVLKESLMEYILSIDMQIDEESCAYKMVKNHYKPEESKVVSFNYTNSFDVILDRIVTNSINISASETRFVHGEAKKGNIIFGVDDSAAIQDSDSFLYKSTSEHYNGREIVKFLQDSDEIYIFGHSLGESDHMYFKQFLARCWTGGLINKKIVFYPYGEQGHIDLHKQLHILTQHNVSNLKNLVDISFCDSSQ